METMFEALYENLSTAYFAVLNLRQKRFESKDISLIVRNFREQRANNAPIQFVDNTKLPAWADYEVIVESLTTLLMGMVTLSVPEIGPLVAAGPVTIALHAAEPSAEGVMAALMKIGVDEDEAEIFNGGLQKGHALVMVHADPGMVNTASTILRAFAPIRLLYHQSSFPYADNSMTGALSNGKIALLANNRT